MFRIVMLCLALITPSMLDARKLERDFIVQTPCKLPWVTKYGVKDCVIVGDRVYPQPDGGDYRWDSRPAILLSSKTKHFALVYFLTEADKKMAFGEVSLIDGIHYINSKVSDDYPGIVFRITHDGGKTWSRFYSPYSHNKNLVESNYLAQ